MDKVEFKRACHEAIILSESKVDLDKNIDVAIDNYIDNNPECNQIKLMKDEKSQVEDKIRLLIMGFMAKYNVDNVSINGESRTFIRDLKSMHGKTKVLDFHATINIEI